MDRFIVDSLLERYNSIESLKSSLDRFIVHQPFPTFLDHNALKSSLDRFIGQVAGTYPHTDKL